MGLRRSGTLRHKVFVRERDVGDYVGARGVLTCTADAEGFCLAILICVELAISNEKKIDNEQKGDVQH